MTHKTFLILLFVLLVLSGCSALMPAPTPTPTAVPTATLPPTATFTPTINAAATQTAQAQATGTAQAQADATRTAQAQASATAQAQATSTAQQATAVARANATATVQALIAAINAQSDAAPGKPYVNIEGKENGQPSPYITLFDPGQYIRNFDAQVQLFNPADGKIHPWDYGFRFRNQYPNGYDLTIYSDGFWSLYLIQKGLADRVTGKTVGSGRLPNLDMSTNGSNTLRLVARDGAGFFFVNGEFISTLDLSELKDVGNIYLATALSQPDNFPGLILRWKNLTIKTLP